MTFEEAKAAAEALSTEVRRDLKRVEHTLARLHETLGKAPALLDDYFGGDFHVESGGEDKPPVP